MVNSAAIFKEIRFIIIDELTHCYVYLGGEGDNPAGVVGWHYKAFPPDVSVQTILNGFGGSDDPIMWPQKSPPLS